MNEKFAWSEDYRPKTVEECILSDSLKEYFGEIVKVGYIPTNMLLFGPAGCGKTSLAKALCEQLDYEYLFINASKDGGIDTLRNDIQAFCSSYSLEGKKKAVILDEADYLNITSTQPALRSFMETFRKNTVFIFTCNYENKIMKEIRESRCTPIQFKYGASEKKEIALAFIKRMELILTENNVQYSSQVLAKLVVKFFPDFRRCINELQKMSISGSISEEAVDELSQLQINKLVKNIKVKDFTSCRKWIVENLNNDSSTIFRLLFDTVVPKLKTEIDKCQAIILINDYQYKDAFVADKEINLSACILELMGSCEFA